MTLYGRVFCAELERQNDTNHTRTRRHISLEELYSAHGYSSTVRSDDDDLSQDSDTIDAVRMQSGNNRAFRSKRSLRRQHQDHHFGGDHGEGFFRSYGFEDSDEDHSIRRPPPRRPPSHQHNSWEEPPRKQPAHPHIPQHEGGNWDSPKPHRPMDQPHWKPQTDSKPPQHLEEPLWNPSSPPHHEELSWSPSQHRPRPAHNHKEPWSSPTHTSNHGAESGEWTSEQRPQSHGEHLTSEEGSWSGNLESEPASSHGHQWSTESVSQPKVRPPLHEMDWPEQTKVPSKHAPSKPEDSWEAPIKPQRPSVEPNSWESSSEKKNTQKQTVPDSWENVPSRSPSKPTKPSNSWEEQPARIQRRPESNPPNPIVVWPEKQAPSSSKVQSKQVPSNAVPAAEGSDEDSPNAPKETAGGRHHRPLHSAPVEGRQPHSQKSQSQKLSQSSKLPPTTEAEMAELTHSRGKGGWDIDSFVASGAGLSRAELEAKKRSEDQNSDGPKFAQAISRRSASRRWRRSAAEQSSSSTGKPKIKLSPAKNAVITVYQPKSLGNGFVVNEPIGQVETDDEGYFDIDVVISDYFKNVVLPMRKPYFTVTHTCKQSSGSLKEPCRYVSYLPLLNERDLSSTTLTTKFEPTSEVSKVVILGMENEEIPTSKHCPMGSPKNIFDVL